MTWNVLFGFYHCGDFYGCTPAGHSYLSVPMMKREYVIARAAELFAKMSVGEIRERLNAIKAHVLGEHQTDTLCKFNYYPYSHPDTEIIISHRHEVSMSSNVTLGNDKRSDECEKLKKIIVSYYPSDRLDDISVAMRRASAESVAVHKFQDIFNACEVFRLGDLDNVESMTKMSFAPNVDDNKTSARSGIYGVCRTAIINLDAMQLQGYSTSELDACPDYCFPNSGDEVIQIDLRTLMA